MGNVDFSRLPRYWDEDIGEFLFDLFAFSYCFFLLHAQIVLDQFCLLFACYSSFGKIFYDRRASGFSRNSP